MKARSKMKKLKNIFKHDTNVWFQWATYGTFSHPYGQQVITRESALGLAKRFQNWLIRFGWRQIPVYVGHPDDPNFTHLPEHMNPTQYGRVRMLKVDSDGLWARISWTDAGFQLLREGRYRYLSPRWLMRPIERNLFTPVHLLSLGLTNEPNLPVRALCEIKPPVTPIASALYDRSSGTQLLLQKTAQVRQRMADTGESYPEAWHYVMASGGNVL